MKTTTTILATFFTLSINILFATNEGAPASNETRSFHASLAPRPPIEATFEDMNDVIAHAVILSPVTPGEADFSDVIPDINIDITTLAPVTPSEADFASEDETVNTRVLAPETPSVADFSDGI